MNQKKGSVLDWMRNFQTSKGSSFLKPIIRSTFSVDISSFNTGEVEESAKKNQKITLDRFIESSRVKESKIIDDTFNMADFELLTKRWKQKNLVKS